MKKLLFCLLIPIFLFSCTVKNEPTDPADLEIALKPDPLTITGDVTDPFVLENPVEDISLYDIVAEAGPQGKELSVILKGSDGIMAEIPYDEANEVTLLHSKEKGWHAQSKDHPPQVRIRNIEMIIVRALVLENEQKSVRLLSGDEIVKTWSYGDLFMADSRSIIIEEGVAMKNNYSVTAHSLRNLIPISDYIPDKKTLQLYSRDGTVREVSGQGYIEWRAHQADYVGPDLKTRQQDIIGLWADAPPGRIDQIAERVIDAVTEGRVMMVLIDAMGFMQYESCIDSLPFLSTPHSVETASTTMPSVSSVALASLLSGKLPAENGVTAERIRKIEGEDLFDQLTKLGKKSIVIEGNVKLIDFSIPQRLHADENHSGTTDDEVFAGALAAIEEGADFIFVHFHGYDDLAHTYGPFAQPAIDTLIAIDGYVRKLHDAFNGLLIVTADHGQHEVTGDKLGEHGEFRPSDMIIPILEWKR